MNAQQTKTTAPKFVRTTILEPFPELFGHVNYRKGDGPFYAANSKWHTVYSDKALAHANASSAHLAKHGFTAVVDVI